MKKIKKFAKNLFSANRMKMLAMMLLCGTAVTFAQKIAKYVPYVVKLCYAIAGVVAVVGAISVYIAMNNEEQDVKNILALRNCKILKRNDMKHKVFSTNMLYNYLAFPIFAKMTLKKI